MEIFGEDPEDMFGADWQNIINDLQDSWESEQISLNENI
jgi:hypothetical protein